jgi:hypothetical protein
VFEYEYYADNDFRYSVVIRIFPWPKVEEMITYSFRHLINGITRPEGSNESVAVDQKLSTAQELFSALFPNGRLLHDSQVLQFQDKSCLAKWLRQDEAGSSPRDLYADIRSWVLEQYNRAQHAAEAKVAVRTSAELWEYIMPFTYGKGTGNDTVDFNPWPFVELVR